MNKISEVAAFGTKLLLRAEQHLARHCGDFRSLETGWSKRSKTRILESPPCWVEDGVLNANEG
jgi:hypothetical protein